MTVFLGRGRHATELCVPPAFLDGDVPRTEGTVYLPLSAFRVVWEVVVEIESGIAAADPPSYSCSSRLARWGATLGEAAPSDPASAEVPGRCSPHVSANLRNGLAMETVSCDTEAAGFELWAAALVGCVRHPTVGTGTQCVLTLQGLFWTTSCRHRARMART